VASKALVIFSGGQDSTTCLAWAKKKFDEVTAITFDYGQRHIIEIEAARTICKMLEVEQEVVHVPNILISSSPLTSENELEEYTSFKEMEEVIGDRRELTFVPMRNALFLTIAANRAEALGIKNLVTGVCQEDNANYSDCRAVFIDATANYINTALGHDTSGEVGIAIHTPLMHLTKAKTVELAFQLPGCWAALAFSHTSYDGKYPPIGMNHSNVLRAQGFLEAGLPDPLVLRAHQEGLMALPEAANYGVEALNRASTYVR
jgi:7-cyano-7-deazaguanine synthase